MENPEIDFKTYDIGDLLSDGNELLPADLEDDYDEHDLKWQETYRYARDTELRIEWFFRNLVEAQVAEDHFSFEQVKRCSPKHYSLYSF